MQNITKTIKKGVSGCFLNICKKLIPCKRMLLCSVNVIRKKASMTVEAAIVLPLFLFAMLNLISIIDMYRDQSMNSAKLYTQTKKLAVYSPLDCVELLDVYVEKPAVGIMGFNSFIMYNGMRAKAWNGYDNTRAEKEGLLDEVLVFVTPSGKVYHTTQSCSILKLSLRAVKTEDVDNCRNEDGSKYYPCDKCGLGEEKAVVFVTKYGTRYHTTLECSSIKRTIEQIPLSKVGSRTECSKCKGN